MHVLDIRLPAPLMRAAKDRAYAEQMSLSAYIARALNRALRRPSK